MFILEIVQVDARGRSCPEPVLLTKRVIAQNPPLIEVMVDSSIAKENVSRLAQNSGYSVEVNEQGSEFFLTLKR